MGNRCFLTHEARAMMPGLGGRTLILAIPGFSLIGFPVVPGGGRCVRKDNKYIPVYSSTRGQNF